MWLLLLMVLPEHIRNRKSVKGIAALVVIATLLFWWFNFPFNKVSTKLHQAFGDDRKTILFWNPPDRMEIESFGLGHDIFIHQNCAYTQCEISSNRSQASLESYDAIVIFNDRLLWPDQMDLPDLNATTRRPWQRLVFFTLESPLALASHYDMTIYENYFNWTMTYRLDSDVPVPYGRLVAKESAPWTKEEVDRRRENARRFYKPTRYAGRKLVAWTFSNCSDSYSQREVYVRELSHYVNVDIFGQCENLTSFNDNNNRTLEIGYKFHLSFEDALCPHYVTRRFFQILDSDSVPVVFGGADYSQHAPLYSYIDARRFKPKELADYLKLLDANDRLYDEYFWWKHHYTVESSVRDMSRNGFCDLCRKLHQRFELKSYHQELDTNWGQSNQCTTSFDPKWIA